MVFRKIRNKPNEVAPPVEWLWCSGLYILVVHCVYKVSSEIKDMNMYAEGLARSRNNFECLSENKST